ncbi:DNA mismatch endonuclease Vsr [Pontibacillus yanchengensis]|uniref:DNA mismatch endonuclease Vsr n=2 Tax=Pontibacillus yanchengensis TaxID=462910 RepID=A0ACC7VEP1_9BACI|nr:very short patch repair endonuclease [Pontibacillus yanchengensis]MYL32074.1 DNA mismatch endonuclease Vsr [Pontibacillus yanchengensis]MYL52654.1 DNA mismatch endonuclease Vsr [Pontibacillus yanchengensis]
MAESLTDEQRKKKMGAIKGKETSIERKVSKELWNRGYRFRKNVKNLYGTPDIAIKKYKIVIFLDSCFWHGCEAHGTFPNSNQSFWFNKLSRNKERDEEVNQYYLKKGWHILRIWEHEVNSSVEITVDKIVQFIEEAKIFERYKSYNRNS